MGRIPIGGKQATHPGGIGGTTTGTPGRAASDSNSEMDVDWPSSVDVEELFHIDDDPNAGPLGIPAFHLV